MSQGFLLLDKSLRICICNEFLLVLVLILLVWGPYFENHCTTGF